MNSTFQTSNVNISRGLADYLAGCRVAFAVTYSDFGWVYSATLNEGQWAVVQVILACEKPHAH